MKRIACLSLLALPLALSACGGGSTGTTAVASTPGSPTTPGTTYTYTKLADMSGDRTFQTAGVHYNSVTGALANGTADALGSGATVSYVASTDTYNLSATGQTASFAPVDLVTAQSSPNVANTLVYQKTSASGSDSLRLVVPVVGGVALSYTLLGNWTHNVTGVGSTSYIAVGGAPTQAGDVPKTGTANYTVIVNGSVIPTAGSPNLLNGTASGTFSANFGAGTVSTTLNLQGASSNFGTLSGSGTIASASSGFTGTFSSVTSGGFSGSFFGPQAAEMGMGWTATTGTYTAAGSVLGVKQ